MKWNDLYIEPTKYLPCTYLMTQKCANPIGEIINLTQQQYIFW